MIQFFYVFQFNVQQLKGIKSDIKNVSVCHNSTHNALARPTTTKTANSQCNNNQYFMEITIEFSICLPSLIVSAGPCEPPPNPSRSFLNRKPD